LGLFRPLFGRLGVLGMTSIAHAHLMAAGYLQHWHRWRYYG